jgi:hypothetical protein
MLLTPGSPAWQLRAMVGWDATAITLLALCWRLLLRSDARTTELRAGDEDPGGRPVFVIAVLSSLFSLFAATMVLRMMRGQTYRGRSTNRPTYRAEIRAIRTVDLRIGIRTAPSLSTFPTWRALSLRRVVWWFGAAVTW